MAPLYEKDMRELIDSTRTFYATLRKRDVDELEYSKFWPPYINVSKTFL